VVNVELGLAEEKEAVVVHQFVAAVQLAKGVEDLAGVVVDQLTGEEVQVRRVEGELLWVRHTSSDVPSL
jgi:hypothetical protein